MEVVAGVASVAGILSLLGQSLNGTRKLRDFFVDVSSASTSITNLLEDINSLLQAIESIKDLIEKSCSKFKDSTVELLRVRLEEYTKDICRWFKTAKALHLPSGNRTKIWLKKLWIAVNIKSVNEIRIELERHRQTITLSLSILGRYNGSSNTGTYMADSANWREQNNRRFYGCRCQGAWLESQSWHDSVAVQD